MLHKDPNFVTYITMPKLPLKGALILAFAAALAACSFDYGNGESAENTLPDIVMEKVEYVRVRGGKLQVRFQAEKAERYESRQKMELKNFSFEQFSSDNDVDAEGRAGAASVELESGNISMDEGVRIGIESEDIVIETKELKWLDKERVLSGGDGGEVAVSRSDGTVFSGYGFSANARSRTWAFSGQVAGRYIDKDDDEEGVEGDLGDAPRPSGPSRPASSAPAKTPGAEPAEAEAPDWAGK